MTDSHRLPSDLMDEALEAGFTRLTPRRPQEVSNAERAQAAAHVRAFTEAGYAGIHPRTRHIVDRRFCPRALPISFNPLLGIPSPKPVVQ